MALSRPVTILQLADGSFRARPVGHALNTAEDVASLTEIAAAADVTAVDIDPLTPQQVLDVGTGSRVVYTVPAGKKAIMSGVHWMEESVAVDVFAGSGSTLADRIASGAYTANNNATLYLFTFVLNAGEIVTVDSASSVTFTMVVFEYPDTKFPELKKLKGATVTTVLQTVYTVPTGKVAYYLHGLIPTSRQFVATSTRQEQGWGHNQSAVTGALEVFINDGVADRLVERSTALGAGVSSRFFVFANSNILKAGDVLKLKSDTSGAEFNFFGHIAEVDVV